MMMNDVRPRADLVLTLGPAHIVGAGKAPVIAECWIPTLWVPNVRKTGNGEVRVPAAKHVRTDVRSVIRGLAIFAHPRKAHVAVNDKGRRECQRVTNRNQLHMGMKVAQTAIASTVTNGLAQTRHAMKHGFHGAVLYEDAVIRGAIPIDLGIDVIPIELLCGLEEIIVDVSGSRHVWWRKISDDLRRNRINRNGCLIREGRPTCAPNAVGILMPGVGIIDCRWRAKAGEISIAKRLCRHRNQTGVARVPFKCTVPTSKKEQLVFLDRPAESPA